MSDQAKGVVIAGPESGVGKTIATLVVLEALQTDHTVQPAKAGPDFIDPQIHERVVSQPSRPLDPWLQGTEGLYQTYARVDSDYCVIEGMMGLYDGNEHSTASIASMLDLPVILVVDAAVSAESVGATALGFTKYGDVEVAGVIAQRAGGGRHEQGIRNALPEDVVYCGRIPQMKELTLPDRHLGLVSEAEIDTQALEEAATHIDVDSIYRIARSPSCSLEEQTALSETATTVAMARDPAFQFYYPETVERFRQRGRVQTFSPLAGDPVPEADVVYLPGGYPELHADQLAASSTLEELTAVAADGRPVVGECGGLMVLTETLTLDEDAPINGPTGTHQMAGVLPGETYIGPDTGTLNYTELELLQTTPIGTPGRQYRGHEFHRSTIRTDADAQYALAVQRGTGIDGDHDGLTEYATVGTYSHFHPASGWFDQLLY